MNAPGMPIAHHLASDATIAKSLAKFAADLRFTDIPAPVKDKILSMIALGTFGSPEAVAQTVCHLIENDYINGAVIPVDGGMIL